MIKKVAFTAYKVVDMKRARKFYEETLGLSPGKLSTEYWQEYDLPGGGCFALTNFGNDNWQPSSIHGGSIAFEVDDIEKVCADLKAKKVKFKMDLFDTPVCKMAVIIDSEDNALMLHQLARKS